MVQMKKIENPQDRERKEQRNKIILGVILTGLMLLGTGGYAFMSFMGSSGDNQGIQKTVKYNGISFTQQGEVWETDIQGHQFYFHYLPNETSQPKINKTIKDYSGKPLYIVGDRQAEQEIVGNIVNFVQRWQEACYSSSECTGDLPVKNCSDNLIIIKNQGFTNTVQEDNCVFISANDTLKSTDGFLFKILGIS
jgi:hypothetical protein